MFKVNDKVKIINSSLYGKVYRIIKDKCVVKINDKDITIESKDLELFDYKENLKSTHNFNLISNENFIPEIMIRHKTKEEGLDELEKFIDQAILNKASYVKIIHGKGGGILRNAVHEYLKTNKFIQEYKLGEYYEGSYGVTIAHLKLN